MIAALPVPTLVLDGEIFDQQMRSRFDLLRHAEPSMVATPPIYITFDLLYRDGIDVGDARHLKRL